MDTILLTLWTVLLLAVTLALFLGDHGRTRDNNLNRSDLRNPKSE